MRGKIRNARREREGVNEGFLKIHKIGYSKKSEK